MPNILKKISKKFSLKALFYDSESDVQKISANQVIQVLQDNIEIGSKVLDIGSGTGWIARKLRKDYNITQLDISYGMCKFSKKYSDAINADFHNLPIKQNSFDAVISSYALHWANDLELAFSEINKILKKNGLLILILPIHGSLKEVEEAFKAQGTKYIINPFPKETEILDSLNEDFRIIKTRHETKILKYEDLWEFLRRIKSIGASTRTNNRYKLTKTIMQDASDYYASKYSDELERVKVYWNNLLVVARKI